MAEDFASAFKRYWAIIVTVGAAMVFAGGVYMSLRDEVAVLRSDLRDYVTERAGLLRDINGNFDRINDRLDRLEGKP